MACKSDRRRKSFFRNIFGVKGKKASREYVDPINRSGTTAASIQREEPLDLIDLTGTYSASTRRDIRFNPIESPIFTSPSTPIFVERFSGKDSSSNLARMAFNNLSSAIHNVSGTQDLRIFVATWNVGGKSPRVDLNLNNLLPDDDQSDIYVLGFQEIVPLNAGNVLVIEDSEPAVKWLGLINKALNRPSESEGYAMKNAPSSRADTSRQAFSTKSVYRDSKSPSSFFQKSSLKTVKKSLKGENGRRFKTCNCPSEVARKSYIDSCFRCPQSYTNTNDSSEEEEEEASSTMTDISSAISTTNNHLRYCLVACKQMVGIFVTVWVKREHTQHIGHLRLSSIGRGILGYLGNKGCISVSMSLYETSFCFVCSHLASGEKEGDELRRNSDVIEILKNTQFQRICKASNRRIPERILEHDRVIWVGDLNYRIALSYTETRNLLSDNDWDALFEKDQLKIEREAGRVFRGWNEGKIYFAPTYKYSNNSDAYAGESVTSKKKRRTPAWCDRILWYGDGIVQLFYIRGESRFSDHRPVCASFIVEVELPDSRLRNGMLSANMKVGVEELLPQSDSFSLI